MDHPPPAAPQRTSDLLTIPDQIPADWPAAFQSARIKYIIPADQAAVLPGSADPLPPDHPDLLAWLDKLIKTPTRPSVYLGESLTVHILLSLTEPAKVESKEHHHIQSHLLANLSIHVQGSLLPASPTAFPSARSERYDSADPSPIQNRGKQSNSLDHPQPSIRVPHSPASSQFEAHQLSNSSQLFTASFSHPKRESHNESDPQDSNHSQTLKPSNSGSHVTIQVAKLANQWLVVWKVDCEIGNKQNSTQPGSLALSTVITYHATQSPILDPPGASILSIPLLSDSPPNFNPQPPSSRVAHSGFENAIEIDLFDGMGRDVAVSLTRPLIAPGSSASVYQNESSHKTVQSNRQGPPTRFSHSHVNSKISNPSRSEDYLPSLPEERRQSAPAVSVPIVRRAFSSAHHKEPTPIRLTHQEIEPRVSDLLYLEKHLSSAIPIVDPLILRVDTIAPQHRLKPQELTNEQLNHPEIEFIEMEKPFNPMLMLELCYSRDSLSTAPDDDFLIDSLDIKLEQEGLLPEFDNFVGRTIKIVPIHPTQPPADNLPYRISQNEVHSLIYAVQIEPADLPPEQGQHRDSSSLQYGCPPIYISLPPSTLISNVSSAFKHRKSGIPIVQEGHHVSEDENMLSSAALGRADNYIQGNGSTTWATGRPQKSIRVSPLGKAHDSGLGDPSVSEARHLSLLKKPAAGVYSLSIAIRGKMVSHDSKIESTGPIGATWTSLLSSLDLSEPTTLDLRRQATKESLGIASIPWPGDEHAERFASRSPVRDLMLPGRCDDDHYNSSVLPRGGLVAGSKRHTASNLINALQELSTFQKRSSTGGVTLTLERSRMHKKQLSPLAIGHDTTLVHQKAHGDDLSLPDSPPSSVPNTGRRFLPNNRQRTPTLTTNHPSPQVPERAHQPAEGDPGDYPGSSKANRPHVARGARLNTPGLIGSSFGHPVPTGGVGGAFERGRGSGRGEMMIKVNCSSPTGGAGTNRFKVLQEFSVEILVFNRSSSASTEGPFKVKILTNTDYLRNGSPHEPRRTHPSAPLHSLHPVDDDCGHEIAAGVVSLDEAIQIGPLGGGECQAVKIRLIGLKPGIFQLQGIHFASIPKNPHQHQQQQQQQMQMPQISQFVLVEPLVVLIE
ncbi:hypothetical protein PtA15_6A437 [Puccinia triticina]|uniref:TRAPP trafficking subunit Trs65-domain-containing protein n=1 Tax=Puccinia triticina TaxID=208348 RepID=A0ABY7CKQ6_9BASI|nr:uncharacterized protein PtA15_6A437 [Puccinia triticina]WAQ85808.1 hypothetical protein PtA15_6A437 [Puccinia triticina]